MGDGTNRGLAEPSMGEVWQDADGCCLTLQPCGWLAFGRDEPVDLAARPQNDQPVRRLLLPDGCIAPERA